MNNILQQDSYCKKINVDYALVSTNFRLYNTADYVALLLPLIFLDWRRRHCKVDIHSTSAEMRQIFHISGMCFSSLNPGIIGYWMATIEKHARTKEGISTTTDIIKRHLVEGRNCITSRVCIRPSADSRALCRLNWRR